MWGKKGVLQMFDRRELKRYIVVSASEVCGCGREQGGKQGSKNARSARQVGYNCVGLPCYVAQVLLIAGVRACALRNFAFYFLGDPDGPCGWDSEDLRSTRPQDMVLATELLVMCFMRH